MKTMVDGNWFSSSAPISRHCTIESSMHWVGVLYHVMISRDSDRGSDTPAIFNCITLMHLLLCLLTIHVQWQVLFYHSKNRCFQL